MLSLLLALACSGGSPSPARPTVVLVSFDTTRADAIGAYSQELRWRPDLSPEDRPLPRTPTVDALARRGTRFAWALASAPTTLPSHTTALSGLDPQVHGIIRNGAPIPAELPLLTARLQDAGYDTVGVIGAMVLGRSTGFDRGFDQFVEPDGGRRGGEASVDADVVTTAALAAVDARAGDGPLFLFAHYFDAHAPYLEPRRSLRADLLDAAYAGPVDGSGRSLQALAQAAAKGQLDVADARQARGLYLAEVAEADLELGRLLAGLAERGLMEDSIVVFMGDHGETLDDAVDATPYSHGPDVDLVDIHVPLLVAGSGRFGPDGAQALPAGLVVKRRVRLLDLAPTLLGLLDLAPIGDGEDLRPLVAAAAASQDPPPAPPSFAVATQPRGMQRGPQGPRPAIERAVAHDGHLLVRSPGPSGDRLYRLADGQPPVDDPARRASLATLLDGYEASAPVIAPPTPPPAVQQQLEALGYVEGGTAPPSPAGR